MPFHDGKKQLRHQVSTYRTAAFRKKFLCPTPKTSITEERNRLFCNQSHKMLTRPTFSILWMLMFGLALYLWFLAVHVKASEVTVQKSSLNVRLDRNISKVLKKVLLTHFGMHQFNDELDFTSYVCFLAFHQQRAILKFLKFCSYQDRWAEILQTGNWENVKKSKFWKNSIISSLWMLYLYKSCTLEFLKINSRILKTNPPPNLLFTFKNAQKDDPKQKTLTFLPHISGKVRPACRLLKTWSMTFGKCEKDLTIDRGEARWTVPMQTTS